MRGSVVSHQKRERYPFGKAIAGGTPISDEEIRQLTQEQLQSMKDRLSPPPIEKSGNKLNLRLAEELDYSQRLLEQVETELRKRNCMGPNDRAILHRVEAAEAIIEDVSTIVEAKNPCDAVKHTSPEVRNRLLRKDIDGSDSVCADEKISSLN